MPAPSPRPSAITGINVTPMVDVMLVLLIIFMVVTPMIAGTIDFLPARSDSADVEPAQEAMVVRVDAAGTLRLGGRTVTPGEVAAAFSIRAGAGRLTLSVEADRRVPYGAVQGVVEAARSAGARSVAIVTEREGR